MDKFGGTPVLENSSTDTFGGVLVEQSNMQPYPMDPDTLQPIKPQNGFQYTGNIDLTKRPQVKNPDGTYSTVRSIGINADGKEVLIPTVSDDGRILSDTEAVQQFRITGKHLGMYSTVEESNRAAQQLHDQQAQYYNKSVQQPTPQLTTTQAPVAVPQTRDLGQMLKGAGQTFLRESGDVAQGLVEGPGAVISGALSFVPAMLSQTPTVLEGVMAGEPVKGLAQAKEGAEKFMEAFSTKPQSRFGKTVAEVAASPFTVAHEGISAGVKAVGGTDEQVKAAQFTFDAALVGLPHLRSKLSKGEKLTPKEVEEVRVAAPEIPVDILGEALKKVEKFQEEKTAETRPKSVVPVAKFAENQSIVDALQVEIDKRTGPRRASYKKALEVVRDHEGDASTLDFSKISKNEGKTRALVKELIEKRKAQRVEIPEVKHTVPGAEVGKEISPDITYIGPNKIGEFNLHEWRDEKTKGNFQTHSLDPAEVKSKWEKITGALEEKVLTYIYDTKNASLLSTDGSSAIFYHGTNKVVDMLDPYVSEYGLFGEGSYFTDNPKIATEYTKKGKGSNPSIHPVNLDIKNAIDMDAVGDLAQWQKAFPDYQFNIKKGTNEEFYREVEENVRDEMVPKWEGAEIIKDGIESMGYDGVTHIGGGRIKKDSPQHRVYVAFHPEQIKSIFKTREEVAKKYAGTSSAETVPHTVLETFATPELAVDFTREENLRQVRSELKAKIEERKAQKVQEEQGQTPVAPEVKTHTAQELAEMYKKWKAGQVEKINGSTGDDAAFNNLTQQSKVPLKESDLPVLDDAFATFNSLEELAEYSAKTGLKGEPVQDPLTKKWYIEPELKELKDYAWDSVEEGLDTLEEFRTVDRLADEGDYSGELSDTGTRNLWDILNNDRGSVDLIDLKNTVDKLKGLQLNAEKLGKTVGEMLDMIGVESTTAEKILAQMAQVPQMQEEIRKGDPVLYDIFNPDPKSVVSQTVKHYKNGTVTLPAVTLEAFRKVWGAKKEVLPVNWISKGMDYNTIRINSAERLGVKELLYDKWVAKKGDAAREFKQAKVELRKITKGLTKKEREDLSIVAHARQHNGPAILAAEGITSIPTLTPKLEGVYELMRGKLDTLFDRINYNRVRTGRRAIPKRQSYFPMIHKANALEKAGVGEGLTHTPLTKIQASSAKFNGTYFPFAKPRNITDIPIELDIFDAYEKYLSYGLDDLHTAPIAALTKELAGTKVGKGKKAIGLAKHNPGMYKFLTEWSDEILGIDHITQGLNAKFPGVMKWYNIVMNNIVMATLGGNIGTIMKQPLALRGVWADTTTYDVMRGITQTLGERTFFDKTQSQKSNILQIRTMELAFDEMARNISKHGLKGLKDNAGMVAMWPMQIVDGLTAESGWNAGYSYAKRKLKYSDEKAFQYAEDLVTRTQGVGVRGATAPIQATRAFKFATMFGTFAINDFNYLARDVIGIKNPNPRDFKQVRKVLKYVAAGMLVNTLARMADVPTPFPSPFGTYDESREEGMGTTDAVIQSMMEFLEVLPPPIGGALKYQSNLGGPMFELAKTVPETLGKPQVMLGMTLDALGVQVESLDWYNMTDRQKLNTKIATGKVLGSLLGVPMTNQLMKSIRTSSNGGDWYETLMGIYVEAGRGAPPRPPSFEGGIGGVVIPKFNQ